MANEYLPHDPDLMPAVATPVQRPVRPVAWMVRQGVRTYYVSDAEFVRSSYDYDELVPLYGPGALEAERERCAKLCDLHSRLTWNDDRKAQSRLLATEIRRGA